MKKLILASGSPRRKELLMQMNLAFETITSDVDENISGAPEEIVTRLAEAKAQAIANDYPDHVVLGSDTIVALADKPLGKPKDHQEARTMLQALSGRTHVVMTGVAIICGDKKVIFAEKTEVTFYELTDEEVNLYLLAEESYDKAGGYGIQGFGAMLVKEIKGDYYNVVGLPVARVLRVLQSFSIHPHLN